jgi:hypothetical protein
MSFTNYILPFAQQEEKEHQHHDILQAFSHAIKDKP